MSAVKITWPEYLGREIHFKKDGTVTSKPVSWPQGPFGPLLRRMEAGEILAKLVLGEAVEGAEDLPNGMALDTSELKRHYARIVLGKEAL